MSEGSFRPTDVPTGWGPPPPPPDVPSDLARTGQDPDPVAAPRTDTTIVTAGAPDADSSSGTAGKAKEAAKAVGSEARDEAKHVAEAAKDDARQTAGLAADKAKETVGEVRYQAREVYDHAKATLVEQATTQQGRLAGALGSLSSEFNALAEGTASADSVATGMVRDASRYVGGVAEWLESRSLDDVLDEVTSFARRHPGRFLLIAAAAGLVAGRVVRGMKDGDAGGAPRLAAAPATPSLSAPTAAPSAVGPYAAPAEPVGEGVVLPPPRVDAAQPGGFPGTRFS
jgi:hypothetical protein